MYKKKTNYRKKRTAPKTTFNQRVKKVIMSASETKYVDINTDTSASSSSFGWDQFNSASAIGVGAGRNNRIGNKIKIIGMSYFYRIYPGDYFNECRFLLINRKDGVDINATSAITILQGPTNTESFKILKDNHVQVYYQPYQSGSSTVVPIFKFIKGKVKLNMNVTYDPTQNNPAEGGMLGFQFHSDSAGTPHPSIKGYCRIYFKDL